MKQQLVWKILLTLIGASVVWLGVIFLWKAMPYLQYKGFARGSMHTWEAIEVEPSLFKIQVNYTYPVGNREYEGKFLFSDPTFSNSHIAEETMEFMKKQSWEIWYRKKSPDQSIMQRTFPYKAFIYFIIAFGVLIYFFYLRSLSLRDC